MAPRSLPTAAGEKGVRPILDSTRKGEADCDIDEAGTLTLKRKAAVCAGLMASEAMGVFNYLNEMPLLQAVGSPVSLLTLPGVVSAAVALILVPLQGWLSDGGSSPRQRKKTITIAAFCVGFLGLCLNLSAIILHTWGKAVTGYGTNHSVKMNGSGSSVTEWNLTFNNRQVSQPTLHGFETMTSSRMNLTNETEFATLTTEAEISLIPSIEILGLPLAVVLSMAGFVVTDVGFDLINTAVKTLALTHSVPADHVSLLVTGVFMSALGGCTTSVTGLVDLGGLFPNVDIDPVSSQAMVQLAILFGLNIVCCTGTLLSAPRSFSHADVTNDKSDDDFYYQDTHLQTAEGGIEDSIMTSMTLRTEVQENVILATRTPADALLSTSTQIERSFMGLSVSTTLSRSHIFHSITTEDDKIPLVQKNSQYQTIPEDTTLTIPETTEGCLGNRKVKLSVVWLASFFSGCTIFIFTVTIADYMGKVVLGGDPEAEADSESYLLYQQGMHSASLCALILNVAYITLALCHSKVLATISPKTEYIVVSLVMMILMAATRLTANVWIIYITAAVVGLNRAAMYTVPFVLATQLYQQAEAEKLPSKVQGSEPHRGWSGFGSTMALVTTSMPSAYLVVSTVIGPLVDLTGDPSAPLLIGIVCSFLAATTVFCYKS